MPLKIRCPHCERVLLAEDWTAGQGRFCPLCGRGFTVPLPATAVAQDQAAASARGGFACARCGRVLAPGTRQCRHCLSDPQTGQRLPLRQRLALYSARVWVTAAAVALLLLFGGYTAAYLLRLPARGTIDHQPRLSPSTAVDWEVPAAELFKTRKPAERVRLRRELLLSAAQSGAAVAAALDRALNEGRRSADDLRAAQAAIEILAETGDPRWNDLLREAQQRPALRRAAIRARAALGDAAVLDEAVALWLDTLETTLLLRRAVALDHGGSAALRHVAQRSEQALHELTAALRYLGHPALARVLDEYWQSWGWLGQERGDELLTAAFQLAQPELRRGVALDPIAQVRAARRTLEQLAGEASSFSRRAAVLLTLAQNVPQYQSLRERLFESLLPGLRLTDETVRQRIVWTLAKVGGRSFGPVSAETMPERIEQEGIAAAAEWASDMGLLQGAAPPFAADERKPPNPPARRVITPERQLEQELLRDLAAGEPAAVRRGVKRWREARLGFTPRIAALLDPATRDVPFPARLGALVIAGSARPQGLGRTLEAWQTASDQPPCLRFAAAAARLAAGELPAAQAANLPRLAAADIGEPAILALLGYAISDAGPKLRSWLNGEDAGPPAVRTALLRAADAAAAELTP